MSQWLPSFNQGDKVIFERRHRIGDLLFPKSHQAQSQKHTLGAISAVALNRWALPTNTHVTHKKFAGLRQANNLAEFSKSSLMITKMMECQKTRAPPGIKQGVDTIRV